MSATRLRICFLREGLDFRAGHRLARNCDSAPERTIVASQFYIQRRWPATGGRTPSSRASRALVLCLFFDEYIKPR